MSKKLMGSISPAYGIATGEGLFGKVPGAGKGVKSFSPVMSLMDDDNDKKKDFKAGGKVSGPHKHRGDGCCIKGKTRGRMR